MAEPVGIFIEFDVEQSNLKKLLNQKLKTSNFDDKVGYYFSELLYQYNLSASNGFFILNYEKISEKCYIGWLQNYYEKETFYNFKQVLQQIAHYKKASAINYAVITSLLPELIEAFELTNNQVVQIEKDSTLTDILKYLMDKLWSFSEGRDFPDVSTALKKRNFYYKNFKNYYLRYIGFIEEQLKPDKIKEATEKKPYCLLDNDFYTFNNKVYELTYKEGKNLYTEIPNADPSTFRQVTAIRGVYADKNFVFIKDAKGFSVLEGADGSTFNYVKEKWDTLYYKDKQNVWAKYFDEQKKCVIFSRIENADSDSFEYLDFCFGKDKNHIYYHDSVIPIDINNFILNKNGFISDSEKIYHYQHLLPLDAPTFKVLKYESEVNPFIGTFLLEDKNGKYEYNSIWKDEPIKPLN